AKREEAARQAAKREEAARQAAQPGQLSFSRARVKGGASDRQVNARLKAAEGDIRACAATIPAGRRAEVVFTVDGDGFFIDVGGRGDPALLACGVQGVKRLGRLGRRPDTGQVEVTLPLKMEAR
ncbi:hypothetical protein KJ940_11660, partial [Myxococcota bacterium]|nr:hypothetical protein [Myxococcota bacterium]